MLIPNAHIVLELFCVLVLSVLILSSTKILILQQFRQLTCFVPFNTNHIYRQLFPSADSHLQSSFFCHIRINANHLMQQVGWQTLKNGGQRAICGRGLKQAKPLQWSFNPCLSSVYRALAKTRTEVPHLTQPHAGIQPGTIKVNCWGPAAVCTNPEKDISELLAARNGQLCEQAAVIKMTSTPWKLRIVPFPLGKSQAYFQLYFTADNSI